MMSDADMIIELGDQLSAMCESIDDLKRELTVEREAREKAEAELIASDAALKESRANDMESMRQLTEWKQRAESAEQKLREAQEQEPVGYKVVLHNTDPIQSYVGEIKSIHHGAENIPLYAAPIPPADVAELQRENAKLKRHVETLQAHQTNCACAYEEAEHICEYHRKMIEEAKRQAVPEGWEITQCNDFEIRVKSSNGDAWRFRENDNGTSDAFIYELLSAMLSASPKPEGVGK